MNSFTSSELSHAVLLPGGSLSDALKIAAAYNCTRRPVCPVHGERCVPCRKTHAGIHPDVKVLDAAGERFAAGKKKAEFLRGFVSDLYETPNDGERKVYVFLNAGEFNAHCQNSLLAALEEPPRHAAFVLTERLPGRLLPTVRSRLFTLNAGAVPEKASGAKVSALADAVRRALKSGDDTEIIAACLAPDREKFSRPELVEFIEEIRGILVELRNPLPGDRLSELRDALNERNAGVGHVCGALAAALLPERG